MRQIIGATIFLEISLLLLHCLVIKTHLALTLHTYIYIYNTLKKCFCLQMKCCLKAVHKGTRLQLFYEMYVPTFTSWCEACPPASGIVQGGSTFTGLGALNFIAVVAMVIQKLIQYVTRLSVQDFKVAFVCRRHGTHDCCNTSWWSQSVSYMFALYKLYHYEKRLCHISTNPQLP